MRIRTQTSVGIRSYTSPWVGEVGVDAVVGDRLVDLVGDLGRSVAASALSTPTTTWPASVSKCRRSASRVSLRPIPSVPSGTNSASGTKRAICSGTIFMKSVTATIGAVAVAEQLGHERTRGSWLGCRRFHRSVASASSRSALYDVADHSSTPTS